MFIYQYLFITGVSILFAIIIVLVELIPEKCSKQLLLSDHHPVLVVGGPVPLLPLDHALGAAHELALGPSNSQGITSSRDSTLARSTTSLVTLLVDTGLWKRWGSVQFTITQMFVISWIAIQHERLMAWWWFLMAKSQLVRVMFLALELSYLPMYSTSWSFSTGGNIGFNCQIVFECIHCFCRSLIDLHKDLVHDALEHRDSDDCIEIVYDIIDSTLCTFNSKLR